MPLEPNKYQGGFDYWSRVLSQASSIITLSTLITYPLDVIHTRMTTDMTPKGQQKLYTTTFDCFNRTNIDEGRGGLYKGWQVSAASSGLRASTTLFMMDFVRNNVRSSDSYNSNVNNLIDKVGVSMFSSLIISLALYPFDTVKRCLQLNGVRSFTAPYDGVLDVFKKLGPKAMYRGMHLFIMKEFLTAFAQLTIYDTFKLGSIAL